MNISGINKLTLMDYPMHTACILFVSGCNMRCPYCHNSQLVIGHDIIDQEEIDQFLSLRRNTLEGVVISGGEPTIYPDLPEYLRHIRQYGYLVKLDTNGTNPTMLQYLIDHHLVDYVAMDIKNSLDKYCATTGRDICTSLITKSISILSGSNIDYEYRTTVVSQYHNRQSFVDIAQLISGAPRYYLQQYVDNGSTFDNTLSAPTRGELLEYADIVRHTVTAVEIR